LKPNQDFVIARADLMGRLWTEPNALSLLYRGSEREKLREKRQPTPWQSPPPSGICFLLLNIEWLRDDRRTVALFKLMVLLFFLA
jgi:hypothetical protein